MPCVRALNTETPTRSTTSDSLYDNGTGVPQDDAEAERWYRLAAEQGHFEAQYQLGLAYDAGHGVAQGCPAHLSTKGEAPHAAPIARLAPMPSWMAGRDTATHKTPTSLHEKGQPHDFPRKRR